MEQSPRLWYQFLKNTLTKLGFITCPHNEAVFVQLSSSIVIIGHVDDFLIFQKKKKDLVKLKKGLKQDVKLDKIGQPKTFLGNSIKINYQTKEVWIDLKDYTHKLLEKYGILNSWKNNVPNKINLYNKPQEVLGVPGLKLFKNTEKATLQEIESYQS